MVDVTKEQIEEALESPKVESLLEDLNLAFAKALGTSDVEFYEILEEGLRAMYKKPFYIVNARIGSEGDKGLAIEFEAPKGDIVTESAYRVSNELGYESVSTSMVEKIREMAYLGYELVQGRSADVKEVFK